jgi:type IV secretory pathway VirB2 component (pilin)
MIEMPGIFRDMLGFTFIVMGEVLAVVGVALAVVKHDWRYGLLFVVGILIILAAWRTPA